ncbi:MAG: penicillin-binding protein 2 [Candidatus Paceibacteria bacterium]|jgi:penicillin-binding protein 2
MRRSFFKRKYRDFEIEPDQIFMDDLNVSDLNQQQFEGVIEKPISQKTLLFLGGFIILIFGVFFGRLIIVQLAQGDSFLKRSENNRLKRTPLFAERGVIYDRNNNEIAWNTNAGEEVQFSSRAYTERSGHGHLLGYVNYPQTDSSGNYWRTDISGQTGIEKKYNQELAGTNGSKLIETDAFGEGISNNIISMPENGTNILTTVDTYIQHYLYEAIKIQAEEAGFQGGAASVMDVHTGELLAFTSYPEFDPYTLAEGDDVEKIQEFFNDPRKPFLNRVLSGLYSPGSTVKPFLGIGALNEGLINENTKILSTGRIEVPNRFNPDEPSIFRDWRPEGHGLTDIRHAIADSVNTFFYAIGGGWKRQDGLGISRIEEYIEDFGIAQKTGIDFGSEATGTIPNPEWKDRVFDDGTWRLGDTYITSIGQFGFQVTPIQMTRATAALANNGKLLQPLLVRDDAVIENIKHDINQEDYELIRLAMRDTVTKGTAGIINIPEVKMAAKTGTAQVGVDNEFYNSWIIGFFPYDDPLYAFSLVMERGPQGGDGSAGRAMRAFVNSVSLEYPEFWENI